MDDLVELCVKEMVVDALCDKMVPAHEARQRAESLWKAHKAGLLNQELARNEHDVRGVLGTLQRHGYLTEK